MRVSVISAVFNGAATLQETIDSVRNQDFPNIEYIVIDGASTDGTMEVVRGNAEHISQSLSEPDTGVYDAFNKGLRLATGDVVAFLNCGDTYASPSIVSTMMRAMEAADVPAVFADVHIVAPNAPYKVLRHYSSRWFSGSAMRFGLMPAHPSLFLKRAVYEQCGAFDPTYRIAGDFELCIRAFARAKTPYKYVRAVVARMPAGGLSNRGWRSKLEITREMLRACRSNGIATNFALLCLRFPLKAAELLA